MTSPTIIPGEPLIGAAAVLFSAFCYAVGPMVLKRHLADLDPRASMGAALAVAAVVLTPAAVLVPPAANPSGAAILSLVVLGLFCTAAAFAFYGALVAEAGPGRALVITYIAPVVAVALGVAILGERPGAGAAAGLLLILAGSWLATGGRMPPGLRRPVAGPARARLRKRATQPPAPPSLEPAARALPRSPMTDDETIRTARMATLDVVCDMLRTRDPAPIGPVLAADVRWYGNGPGA